MNAKGNAATIEIVCNGFSPPLIRSPIAIAACIKPHTIFFPFGGLIFPLEDNIDNTKVPESADVMKKMSNKIKATKESNIPNG